LKISHKNELITVDEQYRNQIDMIKELHKQQSVEYQQQIDKLLVNILYSFVISNSSYKRSHNLEMRRLLHEMRGMRISKMR
jgi:hypothetical protein